MELTKRKTNFQKHLNFEDYPESKEFKLNKCVKVLSMIARLKDRNQDIIRECNYLYGKSKDGKNLASEVEFEKFNKNLELINRLKKYYNYCLSNVGAFDIKNISKL